MDISKEEDILVSEIKKALVNNGLSPNPRNIGKMADVMLLGLQNGLEMSAEDCIDNKSKKVKATKLAKKMYPDASINGDYLIIHKGSKILGD